jgi:FMN phosphatase YigB (HAD superfamily)
MNAIRAVICDVYHTLFEIGPAPADADARWRAFARECLDLAEPPTLVELSAKCRVFVEKDHAASREAGVQFPEVVWPDVMRRALPELERLPERAQADFIYEHMQFLRTIRLAPGAAEFLRGCVESGRVLGIISNAQAYTLRELRVALAGERLESSIFDPQLTMWSFEYGFAKPNTQLFRMVAERLEARGIARWETLMVGDRMDNDIEPAHRFGWRTWRLDSVHALDGAGSWDALRERMFAGVAQTRG